MARLFNRDTLKRAITLKRRLLATVQDCSPQKMVQTAAELEVIRHEYQDFLSEIRDLPESIAVEYFIDAIQVAGCLCRWYNGTLEAVPDAQIQLESAKARCLTLEECFISNSLEIETSRDLAAWIKEVLNVQKVTEVSPLVRGLGRTRLPVFYSQGQLRDRTPAPESKVQEPTSAPVVKLIFSLDNVPLVTPQAIRSGIQHDLKIDMTAATWPDGFDTLQVDYISTMAPTDYYLTPFTFAQSDGYQQSQKGHCIFHYAQSLLSDAALLKVRARFISNSKEQNLNPTILGYPEIQLRALSEASYPVLAGYSTIDIQIPKILQDVRQALPDLNPSDFDDFTKCLISLARYAGAVVQTSVFKGCKVSERDFQQDLLRYLRITELSSHILEGEKTSGGILDLRYHNIIIELKVETKIADRSKIRSAYIEQPAQYTAHAVPLSIACILDMTEKEHPPANIANNITLETPMLHGFEATAPTYPSKVAVIIIDGNIQSPSNYS